MSILHRALCRLGIHEWSRWTPSTLNWDVTVERSVVRCCWCCGKNERKTFPPNAPEISHHEN